MAISRLSRPWFDNLPLTYQLWSGAKNEGNERDLSDVIGRDLLIVWRDRAGEVVLQREESDDDFPLTIDNAVRGIVTLRVTGSFWEILDQYQDYEISISAYGAVVGTFPFSSRLPDQGCELFNGVRWYAGPREVEEVLGPVPGVTGELGVILSGGWIQNSLGYFEKSLPDLPIFGIWIDDVDCQKTTYSELATKKGNWFTQIGDRVLIKFDGVSETDFNSFYIETAKTRYNLRAIEEASRDVDRKTSRFFNKQWVIRETRRTLLRQRQVVTEQSPVTLNEFFRLDTYSYTRNLFARYMQEDFFPLNQPTKDFTIEGQGNLHLEKDTGIITLSQNYFDFEDSAYGITAGLAGLGYFPPGENNMEISYVAGYEKPPVDIAEAVANLAAIRLAVFFRQAITAGTDAVQLGCANLNLQNLFASFVPGWQQSADFVIKSYQRVDSSPL